MNALQYVRTDKNGTKIFYDWNCPRCGGAGEAQKWEFTGRICYACGGTGKRAKALVVKEYTDEYAAKLEARRVARQAKYDAEHAEEIAAAKAEQEKRDAEWRQEIFKRVCKGFGLGVNGIGYVLKGNTYPVKNVIREKHGKWFLCTKVWVCPEEITYEGVRATKIDIGGCKISAERGVAASIEDAFFEAVRAVTGNND